VKEHGEKEEMSKESVWEGEDIIKISSKKILTWREVSSKIMDRVV